MIAFTKDLVEKNYTNESWATFENAFNIPENSAAKAKALDIGVKGLVMTAETKTKVDAMSNKIDGFFKGQNSSSVRQLTLHMDKENQEIRLQVFNPLSDLIFAIPGTGMKTAFTQEPINFVTAQNGTAVSLYDAKGERDVFSAAIAIADAMEKQFGVKAMSATLGEILALDEDVRTMKFMFGCSDKPKVRDYNVVYTLKFEKAPITFAPNEREKVIDVGKEITLKPVTELKELTWFSSNTKVATVDQNGTVKGVGDGIATISVSSAGVLMPAQTKITVLGSNTVFTYGYSESDLCVPSGLEIVTVGKMYNGSIDLPKEGDETALFIKMPNIEGKMTLSIKNSMGTFEFEKDVPLKNKVLKIPSKFVRDSYSESNYAMTIEIADVIYSIRFNNTNGVVPTVDKMSVDVGTYDCGEKKLYVVKIGDKMKAFLPGDTGWADVVVSDGLRIMDGDGKILRTTVKMGYSENVQVACDKEQITIIKTNGKIGVIYGEVYKKTGDAVIGALCPGYYFTKLWDGSDTYKPCSCATVNGSCPHGAKHFTLCTNVGCKDTNHIEKCDKDMVYYGEAKECDGYFLHGQKCTKPHDTTTEITSKWMICNMQKKNGNFKETFINPSNEAQRTITAGAIIKDGKIEFQLSRRAVLPQGATSIKVTAGAIEGVTGAPKNGDIDVVWIVQLPTDVDGNYVFSEAGKYTYKMQLTDVNGTTKEVTLVELVVVKNE